MGKQSRLKQARRYGKEVKKEPVYNMTQAQLDAYVSREILKFKNSIATELTDKLCSTMLIQTYDVLNHHFNFGNLRLQRFRYYMDKMSDYVAQVSKNPKFDYCSEVIQNFEDKKIDVDKLLHGNIAEHSLRRRCDMEKALPKVQDFPFERRRENGKEETKADS